MTQNTHTLAFLGDAVITLRIREHLAMQPDQKIASLHKLAASFVNAANQARVFQDIKKDLTQVELDISTRAHNAGVNTKAKNFTLADYRKATALEALVGYWSMLGEHDKVSLAISALIS